MAIIPRVGRDNEIWNDLNVHTHTHTNFSPHVSYFNRRIDLGGEDMNINLNSYLEAYIY